MVSEHVKKTLCSSRLRRGIGTVYPAKALGHYIRVFAEGKPVHVTGTYPDAPL